MIVVATLRLKTLGLADMTLEIKEIIILVLTSNRNLENLCENLENLREKPGKDLENSLKNLENGVKKTSY